MINFNTIKRHPIIYIVGFSVTLFTIYELTVGTYRRANIDLLIGQVKVLENAETKLKSQLSNAIEKKEIEKITLSAALMVSEIYNRDQSNYKIVPDTYKKNNLIHTDFYILRSQVEFPPGDYTLEKAYESSKLVDAVTTFVLTMNTIYKQNKLSDSYQFDAQFEGGADKNSSGRKFIGKYNGEYGAIHAKNVLVNGRNRSISIYPNDRLGNAELAFLRSYSVYIAYRNLAKKLPGDVHTGRVQFIANESDTTGKEYRYGKITVRINDNS